MEGMVEKTASFRLSMEGIEERISSFRSSNKDCLEDKTSSFRSNKEGLEDKIVEDDVPNYRGVQAMPYIIGNETFEKLGTMGTVSNLIVYLTTMFNMKSITATNVINIFTGTVNAVPLIGAFISDTYLGRYTTLAIASICSFMGMIVLTLTAGIPSLHPPKCPATEADSCVTASGGQMGFLILALGFLILGAGGIRPCNLAFGADQFNPNTESGKRGINSFFNWYYCTYTFGMMISTTFIVYVQSNVSWTIGLAIPAGLMFMSCALFFLGTKVYVIVKPEGSALVSVVQVVVAALRKIRLKNPENPAISLYSYTPKNSINSKLPYTNQFRWVDKAAIITDEDEINSDGSPVNPWKLTGIQQVEETKCVMRVIPIWASGIIYYVPVVQQNTYAVLQALQSDRKLGSNGFKIPAASIIVFAMLTLTIFIPIYDRIIVPFLRKMTGKEGGITILQRMGIGIVFSIITMIVSGLVEEKRRHWALTRPSVGISDKGGAISSMTALWLIPQLALAGLTEALNSVGQTEFYYKQFPENMRSIAGSFFYLGLAGSFYLSSLLVTIVHSVTKGSNGHDWLDEDLNKGRLDLFYYMIAVLGVLNFGYFLVFAKWYRYKGRNTNVSEVMDGFEDEENLK
ncbi:protein NRT1/ PTR FAMILY 2.11-like [Mercurialis annua]|uniref:protein NRT1/ PTR FAMILY 2.11-like n=1 Tax=Mercurialis annua TaxID=3986 RepID=UPI00215E4DEE|nr:protein NRT1/ PTR FAMILY 2.11-like [Mercurialis annua]